MDFKEEMRLLKLHYQVFNNKELAVKMGLSEDGIKNWIRKKAIPKKHLKVLEKDKKINTNIINGNNNINSNGKNGVNIHGDVHINNIEQQDRELCELLKKLDKKTKEYFYHIIKAEVLKKEL